MITNIDIDEDLVAQAMKVSGARTKREVVDRSDADVKDAVQGAFKANAKLKDSGISVASVNKGVVLLSGKAKSLESHLEAVQVASAVKGVRRVSTEVQDDSGT